MSAGAPQQHRPLIMIVDDTHPVRLMVSQSLLAEGYDTVTAPDGRTATELIEHLRPLALVITDVRMPMMAGEALAGWLRRNHPGVPVLFMSGFAQEDGAAVGGTFLPKPFTRDALCAAVREVLSRRDLPSP